MKYLRQLASESLVYGLAGVISRFLTIFLVPIYTHIFKPEDYGLMSLVGTTIAMFSVFSVLALDSAAGRWYWETEDSTDQKQTIASWAWCQFIVSILLYLVFFINLDWLSFVVPNRPDVDLYFRLSALTLPLNALGTLSINWLRLLRKPWLTMAYSLSTNLINIALSILLVVYMKQGLKGIYFAQVFSSLAAMLGAVYLMGDWIHPQYFSWKRLGEMLQYSLPLIPAGISFWIINLSDRYFIQFYTDTHEVGLYQIGSSLAALVALVTNAFQLAWGPFSMSIYKQSNAKSVYADVFIFYIGLTSILGTSLAIFSKEILLLLTTQQYLSANSITGILAFSYIFGGLAQIAAVGTTVLKMSTPTGIAITLAAVVNILLNFLLVPSWGRVGAAIATLLSQVIASMYIFYKSQKLYPIPYRFKTAATIIGFSILLITISMSSDFHSILLNFIFKVLLLLLWIPFLFSLNLISLERKFDFIKNHIKNRHL